MGKIEKICGWCGVTFSAEKRIKYCNPKCTRKATDLNWRKNYELKWVGIDRMNCRQCGIEKLRKDFYSWNFICKSCMGISTLLKASERRSTAEKFYNIGDFLLTAQRKWRGYLDYGGILMLLHFSLMVDVKGIDKDDDDIDIEGTMMDLIDWWFIEKKKYPDEVDRLKLKWNIDLEEKKTCNICAAIKNISEFRGIKRWNKKRGEHIQVLNSCRKCESKKSCDLKKEKKRCI
jgi:hypothetical protein